MHFQEIDHELNEDTLHPGASGLDASDGSDCHAVGGGGGGGSVGSVGGRWGDNDATTEDDDEDDKFNCNAAESSYFNTSSHLQVRKYALMLSLF